MNRFPILIIQILFPAAPVFAQNPIVPPGMYLSDQNTAEGVATSKSPSGPFVKFHGKENNLFELDWFRFAK
jgi:hypothetical protein